MLAQKGDELLLGRAVQRIVAPLVDGGFDVALFFADGEIMCQVVHVVAAQAELYGCLC